MEFQPPEGLSYLYRGACGLMERAPHAKGDSGRKVDNSKKDKVTKNKIGSPGERQAGGQAGRTREERETKRPSHRPGAGEEGDGRPGVRRRPPRRSSPGPEEPSPSFVWCLLYKPLPSN